MKKKLVHIFLWSWIITLPIAILGAYVSYKAVDRFHVFQVRYDPVPINISLSNYIEYEWVNILQRFRVEAAKSFGAQSKLKNISIFVPEANLSKLNLHMPQTGFEYTKARVLHDGQLIKAKIKYRGDYLYHWGFEKKSIRIKTAKGRLFDGMRRFNLQAPKSVEQLNNYFSYKLAKQLGLLAPHTELVRLTINNKDQGVYVLVEQLKEETLRRNKLMPADIYRGEMVGKDKFIDSGITNLFETTSVWDKVAVNNHYEADEKSSIEKLVELIKQQDSINSQKELSKLLDIEAWARFSAFEALAQTKHYLKDHNWRLYYDPWRQKLIPVIWDPMGWNKHWLPKAGEPAVSEVIETELHQALFKNGDFIRARMRVLQEFYNSSGDKKFIQFVTKSINDLESELRIDPKLKPASPELVLQAMHKMKKSMQNIFKDLGKYVLDENEKTAYSYKNGVLRLKINGNLPVYNLRLVFDDVVKNYSSVMLSYGLEKGGSQSIDITNSATITGNMIMLETGLLPDVKIIRVESRFFPNRIKSEPVNYTFKFNGLENLKLIDAFIKRGNDWERIDSGIEYGMASAQTKEDMGGMMDKWTSSWQLFWNNGNGFNAEDSSNQLKVNTVNNQRWKIEYHLPQGLSQLRIDPRSGAFLAISDVQLKINGKNHVIPYSSINTNNMMRKKNGRLIVDGGKDPFFYFDVKPYFEDNEIDENEVEISFNPNIAIASELAHSKRSDDKVGGLYSPVIEPSNMKPLIWSGKINLSGLNEIDRPLILKPGTTLLMGEGATLVIRNRLTARGTAQKPIKFLPHSNGQKPWGAVVLLGKKANDSVLDHCEFSEGSGLKGDLFEYTAMLSIHDVSNMVISDCLFKDSKVVDDMVHVVYSDILVERSTFVRANSDALDIDISNAKIIDSKFVESGNDAIDLMTSNAIVIGSSLIRNGDKGVSVGEGSNFVAIDNQVIGNNIGVQAKDNSLALLFNQTITNNKNALSVYKKNWRYGEGGTIIISKSSLSKNDSSLSAKKHSHIVLFDSFIDKVIKTKRAEVISADSKNEKKAVRSEVLPDELYENVLKDDIVNILSKEMMGLINNNQRGASTNVR